MRGITLVHRLHHLIPVFRERIVGAEMLRYTTRAAEGASGRMMWLGGAPVLRDGFRQMVVETKWAPAT